MDQLQFETLLKQQGLTFFWSEPNKIWWVRQDHADGKTKRSDPAGAKDRAAAEQAAARLIHRQYR